jgi:hypothetical protein
MIEGELGMINMSVAAFNEIDDKIKEVGSMNLTTLRLNADKERLASQFYDQDFNGFFTLANSTLMLFPEIMRMNSDISDISARLDQIKKLNVDYSDAEDSFNRTKAEFAFENYEETKRLIDATEKSLGDLEQKYLVASILTKTNERYNIADTLKKNWIKILFILFVSYAAARLLSFYLRLVLLRKKIEGMKKERMILFADIKRLQLSYFKKIKIDTQTYNALKKNYDLRLDAIERELPLRTDRLSSLENTFAGMKKGDLKKIFKVLGLPEGKKLNHNKETIDKPDIISRRKEG